MEIFSEIVKRTLRVPLAAFSLGQGEVVTRQLDAALLSVGFKLSRELYAALAALHPATVTDISADLLIAARELVGDQVEHNVYFKHFPDNVPDTLEFWTGLLIDALHDPASQNQVALNLSFGVINLLDLPKYGKYLHSYADMLTVHE